MIIQLWVAMELHYDKFWGLDRTYYYIAGSDGKRHSELWIFPEEAWQNVTLQEADAFGAMDDEVDFN